MEKSHKSSVLFWGGTVILLCTMSAALAGNQKSSSEQQQPPQADTLSSIHQPLNSFPAFHQDLGSQLVVKHRIPYVTGGIGEEERAHLRSVKNDYNVHVVNVSRDGSYIGNALFIIKDPQGHEIINGFVGPIFYAQLPAGTYRVSVTYNGQTQKKSIVVTKRKRITTKIIWQ